MGVPQGRGIGRLLDVLRKRLPELKERYKISTLGVFGSYARRAQGSTSDLDVLVEFTEAPSLLNFLKLEHDLSDLLGVKVDLVMKDALKPAIGRRIRHEVIPV